MPNFMLDTEPTRSNSETSPLLIALATMISVNLHGLIWILQPVLPITTKPLSERQTVKLVQLTPAEISRLPEFAPPRVLPTLPPSTSTNVSPPSEPARSNIPLPTPPSRPREMPRTIPRNIPKASATPVPVPTATPTTGVRFEDSLAKSRYGYNPSGTTEAESIERLSAWLKKNRRYSRTFVPRPPIPYNMTSPVSEKLPDVKPAGVAVLVAPNGKIVGEPELIRSSGYSKIDQAAIEDTKKRSFPRTGEYVVYQYRVEIEQNNLPANQTSAPTPEPNSTPSPWSFPRPPVKN